MRVATLRFFLIFTILASFQAGLARASSPPSGSFNWSCDTIIGPKTPAPIVTATAEGTVATVDFVLDGQDLGVVTSPSTTSNDGHTGTFVAAPWDSGSLAGTRHGLKATIMDSDGNSAEVAIPCAGYSVLPFTVDLIPPQVSIEAPSDGSATANTSVNVFGKAQDVQSGLDYVTVNDQKVAVGANTEFTAKVNFPAGQSQLKITVVAYDKGGMQATAQVTVQRPASPTPTPLAQPGETLAPSPSPSPSLSPSPSPSPLATPPAASSPKRPRGSSPSWYLMGAILLLVATAGAGWAWRKRWWRGFGGRGR